MTTSGVPPSRVEVAALHVGAEWLALAEDALRLSKVTGWPEDEGLDRRLRGRLLIADKHLAHLSWERVDDTPPRPEAADFALATAPPCCHAEMVPKHGPKPHGWLSVGQAAELLGVSYRMVYKLVDVDGLPAFQIGKVIRLRRQDIDEWLATRRIKPGDLGHLHGPGEDG